jgi:hypothetical protein
MQRIPIAEQIFGQNKPPLDEVLAKDFIDLAADVDKAVAAINGRPAKVKDDSDFASVGEVVIATRNLVKRVEETRKDETDPLFKAQKAIKAHFDMMADRLAAALKPHQNAADTYVRMKAAEARRKAEDEARALREREAAERLKAEQASGAAAARAEGRAEQLAAQAEAVQARADQSVGDHVRTRTSDGGTATARTVWSFSIYDRNALVASMGPLGPFIDEASIEKAVRSVVRIQKGSTTIPGVRVSDAEQAAFR